MKKNCFLVCFLLLGNFIQIVNSQNDPYDIPYYDFVDYDTNQMYILGDSTNFEHLFHKFDTMMLYGSGQIKILQIGASHTQADIFTGQLRKRFQTLDYGYNASRGYIFPFRMANSNNPWDYSIEYTKIWTACRNVELKECKLGLTGISATTKDSSANFTVKLKNRDQTWKHSFNIIKVLHSTDSTSYTINLNLDTAVFKRVIHAEEGYTEFLINDYYTEVSFSLKRNYSYQNYFTLYGIILESDISGVVFSPIGINGARIDSYLKADRNIFEQQLKVFNPDLIIIALGTNDGYSANFDSTVYHKNYINFINLINSILEEVAIITIVPNDCYLYRKKANIATQQQKDVVFKVSKEFNTVVWDIYSVMGGYNSSLQWYKADLMAADKVHFSEKGYRHLADLFFIAFFDLYAEFHKNKKE